MGIKPRVLFVLGGPGSGKGTVCAQLVTDFGFRHLSVGELLRAEVARRTDTGHEIEQCMARGELVSSALAVQPLKQALIQLSDAPVAIVDGFPRNVANVAAWNEAIGDELEVVGLLNLQCSADTMKARVLSRGEASGRPDDNEEALSARILSFFSETTPVIDAFKQQSKVFDIAGEGSREEVYQRVAEKVRELGLDNSMLAALKQYMHENVDVYLKPLVVFLMKNRPRDVHSALEFWLSTEGKHIQQSLAAARPPN